MTPRQAAAWLFLKKIRDTKKLYNFLGSSAMAAHADPDKIKEQMQEWEDDF